MSIFTVTEQNFKEEVLQSEKPVLVDFWATWCGPCKMLSPVVNEIAEEVDTIKVGKINVDEQPALARQFGIMSIPTLILFKNGEVAAQSVGVKPKAALLEMVKD